MRTIERDDRLRLIEKVAAHESGGRFNAMNRDGEFEGRFGNNHPAYQAYHVGLSFGIIQFTQDSGTLGTLLARMRERDPERFRRIFGLDSDELIRVTSASGPRSKDQPPRSARVQPVAGADLWEHPWVDRFLAAGAHQPFQEIQLDLASELYLNPMLPFCHWLGLDTDRCLALVVDRTVQLGRGGARRWIIEQVGPVTDDVILAQALAAFGFDDVREFQKAVPGLKADGAFGPNTHAAMVWFERQRGDDEAFAFFAPSREMMIDLMVQGSSQERWGHRLVRIKEDEDFEDIPLSLLSEDAPSGSPIMNATVNREHLSMDAEWKRNFDPDVALSVLSQSLFALAGEASLVGLSDAIRRYIMAYTRFLEHHGGDVNRYGLLVNFAARHNRDGRGYIMDMADLTVIRGPMPVAHGSGGGTIAHRLSEQNFAAEYGSEASAFSNERNSYRSSLGAFSTYALPGPHNGRWGGAPYTSDRIGLIGRSGEFNDQARRRGVYIHGIPGVGRTQGCPGFLSHASTVEEGTDGVHRTDLAAVVAHLDPAGGAPGGFVWLDAPVPRWIDDDPWLQ